MLVSFIVSADVTDVYGLNILAAQLKKMESHNVKVQCFYIFYDFNKLYPQSVLDDLAYFCKGSDLIGVSLISSAYRNSIHITNHLRKSIDCPIIWGGKHPTIDPDDCIQHADMVVIGEGEDTMLELVDAINSGRSYDQTLGTWVRHKETVIKNEKRPLEQNLDKYLFPDYSIENKFVLDTRNMRIRPMESSDLKQMKNWYPTMITRGCPFRCAFCTNTKDLRKMRARSIGNVIAEIKEFLNIHPSTKRIFFRDDALTSMPMEFIEELSSELKEINLPFTCSGVMSSTPMFKEKLTLLRNAGFVGVKMGIQSGCERVRREVHTRPESNKTIVWGASVLNFLRFGKINYYMITDNPYESEDELIESIRFTSRLPRPFSLSLFSLNFYPGTALYRRALQDGIIENKEEALQESTMVFKNTYLNKVFLLVRHLELPPRLVDYLTHKERYKNTKFQKRFDRLWRYFFRSYECHRGLEVPKLPSLRMFRQKRGFNEFMSHTFGLLNFRWFLWIIVSRYVSFYHRLFITPRVVNNALKEGRTKNYSTERSNT